MHEQFNRCLVQEARAGRRFIVVIDEAQNLDATVLETVRLLSDFETPQAKLMQIILVGQPTLADKLASPALTQLRQRITSISGLSPFTSQETSRFIAHRLQVAGYKGTGLFSPEALEFIAQVSEGIPRQINNYCFHSLSLACAERKKRIDAAIVQEVARDLDINRFMSEVEPPATMSRLTTSTALSSGSLGPIEQPAEMGNAFDAAPALEKGGTDYLSPAEAVLHMRDVAQLLHNWRSGTRRSDT